MACSPAVSGRVVSTSRTVTCQATQRENSSAYIRGCILFDTLHPVLSYPRAAANVRWETRYCSVCTVVRGRGTDATVFLIDDGCCVVDLSLKYSLARICFLLYGVKKRNPSCLDSIVAHNRTSLFLPRVPPPRKRSGEVRGHSPVVGRHTQTGERRTSSRSLR